MVDVRHVQTDVLRVEVVFEFVVPTCSARG